MGTAKLGFLRSLLGFRLKQAHHLLARDGEERLRPLGIAPQDFSILAMISENPGIIQSRLIENLYITRSTCSELIEALIQAGLLERTPIDRRSNGLFLTSSGEQTLSEARTIIDTHTAKLTAHMSEEDVRSLTALLARLSDGQDQA